MSYNGWSNWATWNVNLWIMNEEPLYREWQRLINHMVTLPNQLEMEQAAKQFVFDLFPSGTPDMDHASELADVNYADLVETWLEGAEDEIETDKPV
jgi:hypothetical protein